MVLYPMIRSLKNWKALPSKDFVKNQLSLARSDNIRPPFLLFRLYILWRNTWLQYAWNYPCTSSFHSFPSWWHFDCLERLCYLGWDILGAPETRQTVCCMAGNHLPPLYQPLSIFWYLDFTFRTNSAACLVQTILFFLYGFSYRDEHRMLHLSTCRVTLDWIIRCIF